MDNLKLLRYNTGTDKKLFTEYASHFDAVIMNATIAAYSGSAMADLVSLYKDRYIIDPQTYILQQDTNMLVSSTSKKGGIKKSISQYLEQLPAIFLSTLSKYENITIQMLEDNLNDLVQKVGDFELKYISSFIENKDYNKYLQFIDELEGGQSEGKALPKLLIAPYFMLKESYSFDETGAYLKLNRLALQKFINMLKDYNFPIAGEIVMEKGVLDRINNSNEFLSLLVDTYSRLDFEYIFLWIDEFSPLESEYRYSKAFSILVKELNKIGKKPIMSYGGYDSILLCHKDSPTKMYGVAQSVGYGERRQITPVGGGLPVNKYYFLPTHQRLKTENISNLLYSMGLFDLSKSSRQRATEFYTKVCKCKQCKMIIKDNFENFSQYYGATPFTMKNGIRRNRPTQTALEISARHFLNCKVIEWENIETKDFNTLVNSYEASIKEYHRFYDNSLYSHVIYWIENYAR